MTELVLDGMGKEGLNGQLTELDGVTEWDRMR